jgi:hypothetical protein
MRGEDQKTRIVATLASSPATPAVTATARSPTLATHSNNNIARAATAMVEATTPSTQHLHQHLQQQRNNLNFSIYIHVSYVDQPQQHSNTSQHNATTTATSSSATTYLKT